MKIENLKLAEIKTSGRNLRKNDAAVAGIAESIRRFGFKQPLVVDADGVLVVGAARLKAAKRLGRSRRRPFAGGGEGVSDFGRQARRKVDLGLRRARNRVGRVEF